MFNIDTMAVENGKKRAGMIGTTSVALSAVIRNAAALSQKVRLDRIEIAKYVTVSGGGGGGIGVGTIVACSSLIFTS
jgi:hypothetical protein